MALIVMPGERITEAEELAKTKKVVLGPGLRRLDDKVVACKAGTLCKKDTNMFWVDSYQKRYVPVRGEAVIGVVTAKAGDIFRVDIGAHENAALSYLAFEAATKKNRPDVNVGDLLYARLIVASRDLEPELVCVNSVGKKGKLGVLSDGFVFNCSLNLARTILREDCLLLRALTKEMPFEIAVGLNGRIWIKAKTIKETIALGNAILAAEYSSNEDIAKICENIGNILFT
ncbi:exosome complex component RRP40 [Episyrphus balteatus]|uniref:exosome complex component RRP40 n=1 Tax=Episyrphus balteatus TaxID=286459 RepID=UPI002486488A|nr:exosome complex component RRP40 [Episyrphus balteatus]